MAVGDAGGTAVLRSARFANFGCFPCTAALTSASVSGPFESIVFAVLRIAFLRFTGFAMASSYDECLGALNAKSLALGQHSDPFRKQHVVNDKTITRDLPANVFFECLVVESWSLLVPQDKAALRCFNPDRLSFTLASGAEWPKLNLSR
jgi:hypothetical protein